ncbi:hypothetical protein Y032_0355g3330 [Ancylostoma ceylanicum]|uniref:Uncharacterized protein n=1 Tax=Ancylostoma ceylanicum TaxID=53326 RepID=A0A016RWB3_9BILA|nr:hypothetical protein Y032_0355g3330 [Ancylostoma ceylanicum]
MMEPFMEICLTTEQWQLFHRQWIRLLAAPLSYTSARSYTADGPAGCLLHCRTSMHLPPVAGYVSEHFNHFPAQAHLDITSSGLVE